MVYVVIPVFNRKHYTQKCLELLMSQTFSSMHVIVVDDGSSDGTSEMIRENFPEVEVIRGTGDWYWTGSAYQGVERALELSASDDDYIFMLNDDLEFASDLLERLIDYIRTKPRSIVQALGSWTDNRNVIHYAGRRLNWWTAKGSGPHEGELCSDFSEEHVEIADTLTGRGVLFPIQVFKEVGNYDRRIIHRGDPELSRRAAKAGWDLLIYFGAVVYSYPRVGQGNINERDHYSLRDLREYFFGVLSQAHIKTTWRNARSYTNSFFQAVVFFSCHLARLSWHYLKRLRIINGRDKSNV